MQVIAFVVGFYFQQLSYSIYILATGVILAALVSVKIEGFFTYSCRPFLNFVLVFVSEMKCAPLGLAEGRKRSLPT